MNLRGSSSPITLTYNAQICYDELSCNSDMLRTKATEGALMAEQEQKVPFLATPNGLIILLVLAMIAPVLLPGFGAVASLTLPFIVMWSAYKRPVLGQRWFYLAAIPIVLYGSLTVAILLFGWG